MATTPADQESPEQLKYKTWVLKVSIHCEGCKRKVKKVLQGIEGVYKTDIDPQQHKVIVTGNVESETLLKQLGRYGKHAELWPENPETKTKKKKKKKKKKSNGNGNQGQEGQEPSENDEDNDDSGDDHRRDDNDSGDEYEDELAEYEKEEAAGAEGTPLVASDKKKKKKKKKAQNGENIVPNSNAGYPSPGLDVMSHNLPTPQIYQYGPATPMYYPPPAPPAYGLSYNTIYPRASESYYARDPMHAHYGSGYRYARPVADDVYNLYDDEGGCSIM